MNPLEIYYNLRNEFSVELQKQVLTLSLSKKSDYCVMGGKKGIFVYSLANLQQQSPTSHVPHKTCNYKKSPYDISCTVWNPYSESIIASAVNSQCIVWDLHSTSPVQSSFDAHSRAITDLRWSPSTQDCFATGSTDNQVKLWDTRVIKKPSSVFALNSVHISLAVSRIEWNRVDQFILASAQEGTVSIWDLRKDREPLFHASGAHMSKITAIDWSHSNPKEFITSAGDTMIKFWSIENSLKCKHTMKTNARITSAYFHPEGTTMIGYSQSSDSIRVWDTAALELSPLLLKCGADNVISADWKKETKQLFALKNDQSVVCWEFPMKLGEDHFHSDYYSTVTKKHDKPAMTNTNSDSANANAAKPKEVPSAMPIANGAPIPNSAAVSLGKAADIEVVSAKLIPRSTPTDHDSEKLSQVSSSASGSLKSNSIGGIGDSSPTNSASNLEHRPSSAYNTKAVPIQKKGGFLGKAQESFLKKKGPGEVANANAPKEAPKEKATLEVKSAEPKQQQQGFSPSVREGLAARNVSPGRATGLPSTSPKSDDLNNPLRHDGERQNIPFPRLCSAVFGVNGTLLKIVNVPKDAAPLTKNKMVTVKNYEEFISAKYDLQRHIPADVTNVLFHYYYNLSTDKKLRTNLTVHDYEMCTHVPYITIDDLSAYSLVSKKLALQYTLSGEVTKICQHNENAALSADRPDLVQVWRLLQVITNPLTYKPYNDDFNQFETPWADHPFGRKLAHSIMQHYERLGDVQTLCMVYCVLALPEKLIRSKNKHDGSKGGKINCDWTSKLERMASEKTKKEIRRATSILDAKYTEAYEYHAKVYAEILYRFGLFNQSHEVLKILSVESEKTESFFQEGSELTPRDKHDNLTFGRSSVCSGCRKATADSWCKHCACSVNLVCSLCRLTVLGFSFVCTLCGHGGHHQHMKDWFDSNDYCATGCGCQCCTVFKSGV